MSVTRIAGFEGSVELGPYSQASVVDGLVYTTGQVPASADGGLDAVPSEFEEQVRRTLEHLETVLAAAGARLADVVKVNAYLTSTEQLTTFNRVYAEVFGEVRPSRTTVCVAALWGVALEIEAVARQSRMPGAPRAGDVDARFEEVELATLGHTVERGFLDARIRRIAGVGVLLGRARTLRLDEPDAIAVNRAIDSLEPGEVLCIESGAEARHACIGAVTQAAARGRGARGIVVDGPVTDRSALEAGFLPVHASGLTPRTTKRLGGDRHRHQVPIAIGGVVVHPGHLVLGDENGVLVLDGRGELEALTILDEALEADRAEPELRTRLLAGPASLEGLLAL